MHRQPQVLQHQMNHGMSFKMTEQTELVQKFQLPEHLDVTAACDLQKKLLEHRGHDLQVDAGKVERVGTLCLQVLLAAKKTWSHDKKIFEITEPAAVLTDAAEKLGLTTQDLSELGEAF